MHISSTVLSLLVSVTTFSSLPLVASSSYLRVSRQLRNPQASECTILLRSDLALDDSVGEEEEEFECELDPADAGGVHGISLPIRASGAQRKNLKNKIKNGELRSDESTLIFRGEDFRIGTDGVYVPRNSGLRLGTKKKTNNGKGNQKRNLAIVTGDKPVLVVKVTDSGGLARQESPAAISEDIFGGPTDTLNLKSQMSACSFGQLNILKGDPPTNSAGANEVAPGVIEVDIGISLTNNTRGAIRNAVTSEVQTKLGFNLPGPYEQVLYVLEKCYQDCGWAAYAYINSWNSVYQGNYYKYTGVLMHELGHNFNLAHSGGLDGQTYTDHTGYMGNPWYSDEQGAMCFNAAKTWQIGWYDSNKEVVDPRTGSWFGTLVGIADFANNPNDRPVVLKIETGTTTDQFIAFNRAKGVNIENDEADDEVTIVETGANGEGYSQSYLKAHLIQGEAFSYSNWQGTGQDLTITANEINLSADPGYADISVCLGPCETSSEPTPAPTPAPTPGPTPAPTTSPTPAPTPQPTPAPICKDIMIRNRCRTTPGCQWKGKKNGCVQRRNNGNNRGGNGNKFKSK